MDTKNTPFAYTFSLYWEGAPVEIAAWYREMQDRPLILCLHGLGCSKRTFQELWQVEALASYGILAFDWVGFGESPRDEYYTYDIEEQARLCAPLIKQFADRPIHLVGHSLGGTVAALLPKETVESLASLTLVEGRLHAASCRHSRLISRFPETVFIEEHYPSWQAQVARDPHLAYELQQADPIAFYRSACSLYKWVETETLAGRLAACHSLPMWFLYGDQNSQLPEINSVPGMPGRVIADAGHFPMNDNPAGFYQVLSECIKASEKA